MVKVPKGPKKYPAVMDYGKYVIVMRFPLRTEAVTLPIDVAKKIGSEKIATVWDMDDNRILKVKIKRVRERPLPGRSVIDYYLSRELLFKNIVIRIPIY